MRKFSGFVEHIEKVGSQYRLLSHKGKNLGTFDSHAAAAKHEGEVEYFKAHSESVSEDVDPASGLFYCDTKGCSMYHVPQFSDLSAPQYLQLTGRRMDCHLCGHELSWTTRATARAQGFYEETETEMCAYCSHAPVDPKFAPYCSKECSIRADQDNEMDENVGTMFEDLDRVCMYCDKSMGTTKSQNSGKSHGICDACGKKSDDELDAMANAHHKNVFEQVKSLLRESTTDVSASDIGFKPIKGKNQNFAYPTKLSYGGRSWTKQASGGEHWEEKKLGAIKYADRYGNILKVNNEGMIAQGWLSALMEEAHYRNDMELEALILKAMPRNRTNPLSANQIAERIMMKLDWMGADGAQKLNYDVSVVLPGMVNRGIIKRVETGRPGGSRYLRECVGACKRCGAEPGVNIDCNECVKMYPKVNEDAIEDTPSMTVPVSDKEKKAKLDKVAPDPDEKKDTPMAKLDEGYYMVHYTDGSSEKFKGSASEARAKAKASSKTIDDMETLGEAEFKAESRLRSFGGFLQEAAQPNDLESVKARAKKESENGYVQHVNKSGGSYRISDWYDSDETVASYENGKPLNEADDPFKEIDARAAKSREEISKMPHAGGKQPDNVRMAPIKEDVPSRLCSVCHDPAMWHHPGKDLDYCAKHAPQVAMQRLTNGKLK